MSRTCICGICICGCHRCPPLPTAVFRKEEGNWDPTEYTENYPSYGVCQAAKSMKPKQEYQASQTKMEGTTTFKSDFVPYQVSRRPGRKQAKYTTPPGKIYLGTTYKLEFKAHEVKPFVPKRPVESSYTKGEKLDTMPTYKDDFQPWEMCKREPIKPDLTYHPPSTPFGNSTTFQTDFAPKSVVPRESFKPIQTTRKSSALFLGSTTMKDDFKPWEISRRQMFKKSDEIVKADGKMEHLTTFKTHFTHHEVQPCISFKPVHVPLKTETSFEDGTSYQTDFTPKKIKVCPASFAVPPGFVFEEKNEQGHKFFHKLPTQDQHIPASEIPTPKEVLLGS